MEEIYVERGGTQLGADYATSTRLAWPSASLTVAQDYLELDVLTEKLRFDKSAILSIREFRSIFYTGIVIEHTNADSPRFVLFYPLSYVNLAQALSKVGHTIET